MQLQKLKNTRKFLSNIKHKAEEEESNAFSSLSLQHIEYTKKLNKTTMGEYCAFDIDNSLNPIIDKEIKKVTKQIRKKISVAKMSNKDLYYLINRHLEFYFDSRRRLYEYLKFSNHFIDKDTIPKVASHNLKHHELPRH